MAAPDGQTRRRITIGTATTLTVAAIAAVWLAEARIAERNWLATLVTYAPQWPLLVPPTLVMALALRARKWLSAIANAAVVAVVVGGPMGFRWNRAAPQPRGTIRVVTYNVHGREHGFPRAWLDIERLRPDIACLQETPEAGVLVVSEQEVPQRGNARQGPAGATARGLATLQADAASPDCQRAICTRGRLAMRGLGASGSASGPQPRPELSTHASPTMPVHGV